MELNGPKIVDDWKDNREASMSNEEEDEGEDEVDDNDDNLTNISYKDLFRMATLGGATGWYCHCHFEIVHVCIDFV